MSERSGVSKSSLIVLVAIFMAGAASRFVGVGYALPQLGEPDAHLVALPPLLTGDPTENWNSYAKYPHLPGWMLVLSGARSAVGSFAEGSSLSEHLNAAGQPARRARTLCALLSLLMIPATWFLARRLAGTAAAHLAAALIATSLLPIVVSQQARPHVPAAALATVAVACAVRLPDSSRWWHSLGLGAIAGAAVGCLHFGLFLLPSVVLGHLWVPRGRRAFRTCIALLPVVLAVLLCYPFLGQTPDTANTANRGWLGTHRFGGLVWRWERISEALGDLLALDPCHVLLALVGIVIAVGAVVTRSRRRGWRQCIPAHALIAMAFAVPFFVTVGALYKGQVRFLVQLYPYICCLGGYACVRLFRALFARLGDRGSRVAAVVGVIVVLGLPTTAAVRLSLLRVRPDTLTLAADWLREHADPARDRVLLPIATSLPLFTAKVEAAHRRIVETPWDVYQRTYRNRLPTQEVWMCRQFTESANERRGEPRRARELHAAVAASGARYVIARVELESARPNSRYRDPLMIALRKQGQLAIEIPSVDTDMDLDIHDGFNDHDLFLRVMFGVSWGPSLAIYDMASD